VDNQPDAVGQGDSPHGDDLPWRDESRPEYGQLAATSIPYEPIPPDEPEQLVFEGDCPRCTHRFTYRWPLVVVRSAAPVAPRGEQVIVWCRCRSGHPGRPGGRDGCGAFWRVEVAE
jgi:hypothetical protein